MAWVGLMFYGLRRLMLHEHAKHLFTEPLGSDRSRVTPAWFVDVHVLGEIAVILSATGAAWYWPTFSSTLVAFACLWIAVQKLQTNLFHLVWRTVISQGPGTPAHSQVRNAVMAVISLVQVTWLFGLAYWFHWRGAFKEVFGSVLDSVYFSFVTAATVGYGEHYPTTSEAKILIVLQIVVSAILFAALIARSINLVRPFREDNRGSEE